ncbi:hypothetical protein O1611_g1470 [Lasiodiplodia mahajangana]|uniref:Uncharacterized protein n=1 Tax=Lasiodiplodia mahajangana TaxID=1108764 RepID=A0ACC2JXU8_9PEZI|nr:hypothetical protein O1611_g1470 [Lasiodiplodia mahajangana]
MSRSLDKNILSELKREDPRPAYHDLSRLFTNLPESGLLEIEFLGQSHQLEPGVNYLQDGNAIAIPKLRLVQAFFVARQILHEYLHKADRIITNDVVAATSVLLLMDPEHLTAANVRKRAVSVSGTLTQATLKRELQFVDTLLTARLHRHTKSPTLWSHRRWLVATCWSLGVSLDTGYDIQNVVMVAGERHPRNYVAWQHARFLIDHDLGLVAAIAFDVKAFCLRNHSDISGWAFLSDCITRIQDEETRRSACSSILEDVLSMAESFRWANESVWVFLRTIVAREPVNEQEFKRFILTNAELSAKMPHSSPQWLIMERARQWRERYGVPKVA